MTRGDFLDLGEPLDKKEFGCTPLAFFEFLSKAFWPLDCTRGYFNCFNLPRSSFFERSKYSKICLLSPGIELTKRNTFGISKLSFIQNLLIFLILFSSLTFSHFVLKINFFNFLPCHQPHSLIRRYFLGFLLFTGIQRLFLRRG